MALPRGRHTISAEDVAADQRGRMLAAVGGVLTERGYARATVGDILERSGVSRRTFYEQFEDKDDCLYAAYEDAAERVWAAAAEAVAAVPADDWTGRVHAALAAVLEFVAAEPDTARLFTIEARAVGPGMAARHSAVLDRLAAALRTGNRSAATRDPRAADPNGVTPLPDSTERTLVDNVAALIGSYVLSGATELLPDFEPQLAEHLLASRGPR